MQRRTQLVIAAGLILLLAGSAFWFARDRKSATPVQGTPLTGGSDAEVTLVAAKADKTGVDTASTFRLTSTKPLTLDQVQRAVVMQPAVPLQVEEVKSSREFLVKPAKALEANRIYKVRLEATPALSRAYQWSFQTRATFRVLGSLPRHQGSDVPVDTGIEITFSHENWADVSSFFSISPKVAGRFERHKKTVAFVPENPLQPGTIYSVTLKKGLAQEGTDARLAEDFVFSFETQQSTGGTPVRTHFDVPDRTLEVAAGETPFVQVYLDKAQSTKVDVAVYRYKDAATFAGALAQTEQIPSWARWTRSRYLEESKSLSRAASFTAEVQQHEPMGYFLHFPESLAPGYYLVDIKHEQQVRQVRIQVTDLASYAAMTNTGTLVWLNDIKTGAPVSRATLTVLTGGKGEVTTNADGIGVLPAPVKNDQGAWPALFVQARSGEKESVVNLQGGGGYYYYGYSGESWAAQYWRYVYLDRQLYKPDDRVNVFGILQPREPGAQPVPEVQAVVQRSDYRGTDDKPLPLAEARLKVANGTYTGVVPLPGLKPGWYEMAIYAGEERVSSRYFEVQTYTKPAYQLNLQASKRAVFSGDPVTYTLTATFFEGTPVPGLKIAHGAGEAVTDQEGRVEVIRTEQGDSEYPNYSYFHARSMLPEAGEIDLSTYTMVFGRDMQFTADVAVNEASEAVVTGRVNRITLDKLNADIDAWDYTGDPVAGRVVRGTLVEEIWTKEEVGTYYDFIQKRVQKQYSYRSSTVEVGTFTATTDATGRFTHKLSVAPDKSYRVILRTEDGQGRNLGEERYFAGRGFHAWHDATYRWYNLQPLTQDRYEFGIGEPVSVELRQDRAPLPDRADSFLFYTARMGLKQSTVQDSARFTYALKESDLPGTHITGVYFDGRQYRRGGSYYLRVNPKEKELKVTVETDKAAYQPGDTVQVRVAVKDKQGRPVQAAVNLNLVDEALYALRDQQVNLPGSVYGEYISSGVIRTAVSHDVPQPGGGAEKGGDGGAARKEFKDAVFFETVTTDGNGRAVASFKVPDNLTTWRLTWQAVAPSSMEVANGTVGVKVSLPFFVESVQNETYLTGDRPVLTARTYGTSLKMGDSVTLTGRLKGPLDPFSKSASAKAYELLGFQLPVLSKPGKYQATVEGTGPRGLKDAVQKEFTVVDSYLRQKQVTFQMLEPGAKLEQTGDSLVRLIFSDYERGRYLRLLQQLRWQWGNRFEQKLARSAAVDLLAAHFEGGEQGWWGEEPALNLHAYQTPEGGIAMLPYADGDLYLSALAADLKPDSFDRSSLIQYFTLPLEDDSVTRDRKALALYGMAALGEPVLAQAQDWSAQKDLTLQERLYLALAMAELGDLEGARVHYQAIIREHGEALGANARIKTGRDQDEIVSVTALAGMLSAKLGEPESLAFAGYLLENPATELLVTLEEVIMVAEALPHLPKTPVAFGFSAGGQTVNRELKPGQSLTMTMTQAMARSLEVTSVQGKVGLTVMAEGPITRADLKQQEGFAVSRTYQTVGGAAGTRFKAGDLVRITINTTIPGTAPSGAFELTDYLPAGLRLVERPWQSGITFTNYADPAWPLEVNGQRVTFWAIRDAKYPISYYARVVSPGEFTAEEPVLQHQRSGVIYGHGQRQKVVIE